MSEENQTPESVLRAMMALAGEVAAKVQIEKIQLIQMSGHQDLRAGDLPSDVAFEFRCEECVDRDLKKLTPFIFYRFTARYDGQEPESKTPLSVEAAFKVVYSVESFEGLDDRRIKAFSHLNGIYNSWPYWREYLDSTLGRMSLPTVTMPVFQPKRFVEYFFKTSREAEATAPNG